MSRPYTPADTLRLARRHRNPKRAYLLVNPLQAKHIPVSPEAALSMMEALGERLKASFPGTKLVIGFAETATAIAAVAALAFGPDCTYVHTTREPLAGPSLHFHEEHSHAVLQTLSTVGLEEPLAQTERLLLIDDEISTGRTLRNIARQLRASFPTLAEKPLAAASVLDRLSEEDEALLRAEGMESSSLVKLPPIGGLEALMALSTHAPRDLRADPPPPCEIRRIPLARPLPNPRYALPIGGYLQACGDLAEIAAARIAPELRGEVLVLGTEECMLPALLLGRVLERQGHRVFCHATTRSPIALCGAPDYPIRSGVQLESFYEPGRATYLYNLRAYGTVIVLTDAPAGTAALTQLAGALKLYGNALLLCLQAPPEGEVYA